MRILVADDSSEIRGALRLLLREMGGWDIVEASDVAEALQACGSPDEATSPDVVLLDWELSLGAGRSDGAAGVVAALRGAAPGCRIIALSVQPEAQEESLRAGCHAFVSLTDPPDRLVALLAALAIPENPATAS